MAIEHDFLHVNFGPTNTKAMDESKVIAFHFRGPFVDHRWMIKLSHQLRCSGMLTECAFECKSRIGVGTFGLRNDTAHVDKAMDHAMVDF